MLILAVLVPLAGFAFYDASQDKQRRVANVLHDLKLSTRDTKRKIEDLIATSEELLTGLSATDAVVGNNLFTCTRVLQNVARRFTKYTNFSVVNKDKFIVCSSGSLPYPKDVSSSPNIVAAFETKKFTVSPFKFGVLTGMPVLVFSNPLINSFGDVKGTVNNGLSLTWLGEYLAGLSQTAGQNMMVVSGEGTVMASYPHKAYKPGQSIAGTPLGDGVLNQKIAVSSRFVDESGEEMLVVSDRISRIPDGAYVVSYIPLQSVLAETTRALHLQLGFLSGLAVMSLFIGWIGARILVLNPIEKLSRLARRLQDGDLMARSGLDHTSGELGALAQAYDRMADTLDARTSALRESESNYRQLVENEEQFIHRYLPDTTEVLVNQALANFVGQKPEELVGTRWIEHLSDDAQETLGRLLRSRTPDDPTFVFEHMVRDSKGEERWLRWNNRAFFDESGAITHFQSIGLDLTDRKTVERNLEEAMVEARAANRAKSNFLANMSHELRTPLNSIIGFSEMMSTEVMGELPETYREYTQFITSSGHHLLDIINDILDLSKIEAGMLSMEEVKVDLVTEMSGVIKMLDNQAIKNGNRLRMEKPSPGDMPGDMYVMGDRMRIKQVMLNIVSNANKFTEDGEIVLMTALQDGQAIVSVSDTGIGMTQEEVDIALSPFGQVDGHHLSKRFEGTGLGLPLAEQLMIMHGGGLIVESVPNQGTTVTMTFPASRTMFVGGEKT